MELGQKLSVRSALDRGALANSMNKMRSNLTNNKLELEVSSSAALTNHQSFLSFTLPTHSILSLFPFFLQVPRDHRQVIQNRELKALLDRVDPGKQGTIPLAAMRKTLTKLLPPPPEKLDRVPAKVRDREREPCTHARTHAERSQRALTTHHTRLTLTALPSIAFHTQTGHLRFAAVAPHPRAEADLIAVRPVPRRLQGGRHGQLGHDQQEGAPGGAQEGGPREREAGAGGLLGLRPGRRREARL